MDFQAADVSVLIGGPRVISFEVTMFDLFNKSKRRLAREDGSATIEAVLWLPFFLLVFALTFDTAVLFFAETEAMRVVQDANRLASIGRLDDVTATETFVETALNTLSPNVDATSSVSASGVISTVVTIPSSDLAMFGIFSQLREVTLSVSADHMLEDFL